MDLIICVTLTWFLVYTFSYSPKARVRILLKQMFNIPIKLSRAKREIGDENNYFYDMCKKALDMRYKTIIALLDLYFDPVKDKGYIEEKINYGRTLLNNAENIMLNKK
ncbi:MAG: hypothetical protein PHT40_01895 [Patescibacteria group bacterium]|nr:hypothetical protein [Patescibacteria group bacterium]